MTLEEWRLINRVLNRYGDEDSFSCLALDELFKAKRLINIEIWFKTHSIITGEKLPNAKESKRNDT